MSEDKKWIDKCVSEAQKTHPEITEAVVIRITELLKCQFCEKQLRPGETGEIAKFLISAMSYSTEGESKS